MLGRGRIHVAAISLVLATVAGCGKPEASAKSGGPRMGTLVSMHNRMETTTGRLPPNEEAFKKFITENGAPMLERVGVTSVDELFISERDGQPFVVTYGKYPTGMTEKIVAYEKNGSDGQRLVGYSIGAVELVDEARFREMVPNAP